MLKKYTKEELWKLFEKLPKELQDAIFSVETADSIYDICKRNGIEETSKVADLVGYVLLGVLSPDELQKSLEQELKSNSEITKKVSQEIERFVFYPVKESLTELYGVEVMRSLGKIKPPPPAKEEPAPPKKDVYREPIEEE